MVLVHSQSWTTEPFSDSRTSSSPSKETSCPVNAHQHIKGLIYKRTTHFPVKTEKGVKCWHMTPWMHLLTLFWSLFTENLRASRSQHLQSLHGRWWLHGRNSWEPIRMVVRVNPILLAAHSTKPKGRGSLCSQSPCFLEGQDSELCPALSSHCPAWTSVHLPVYPHRLCFRIMDVSGLWMFPSTVEDGVWIPHSHPSWFWMMFNRPKWQHHFYSAVFLRITA